MISLALKGGKTPLTELEISEFESSINLQFPEAFKSFYKQFNGGTPERSFHEGRQILLFLSIKYGLACNRIDEILKTGWKIVPARFIPFAETSRDGCPFCINLIEGENYGKIYFCTEEGDDPIFVSSNFIEFTDSLTENDDW